MATNKYSSINVLWFLSGKVSYFELWFLVHGMDETNLEILRGALRDLDIPGVEEELTTDKAYDLLCDWKDTNNFDKEGTRLKNVLIEHELDRAWKEMCGGYWFKFKCNEPQCNGFIYLFLFICSFCFNRIFL